MFAEQPFGVPRLHDEERGVYGAYSVFAVLDYTYSNEVVQGTLFVGMGC